MSETYAEAVDAINYFLSCIRISLDRAFGPRAMSSEIVRERYTAMMLLVEESRVRFQTYTRFSQTPTDTNWPEAMRVIENLNKAFQSPPFNTSDVQEVRFRNTITTGRMKGNSSQFLADLTDKRHALTLKGAFTLFDYFLTQLAFPVYSTDLEFDFRDLARIVPAQQVAPVQFRVTDGKIYISDSSTEVVTEDRATVESALEYIENSGTKLLDSLAHSNCDTRFVDTVKELQEQLANRGNVVAIGLANMACSIMSSKYGDELPDTIAAMLQSYTTSVSMYVSQFPEWAQFTSKAAAIELDAGDISEIEASAQEIIGNLKANPHLADPQVPRTIEAVKEFLNFPGASAKRAAFAMLRTIENLVASIITHSISFLDKTANSLVDKGSAVAATVLIGLLGIALTGASGIGGAAAHAGSPWVKQAIEMVQKEIERLGD